MLLDIMGDNMEEYFRCYECGNHYPESQMVRIKRKKTFSESIVDSLFGENKDDVYVKVCKKCIEAPRKE